MLCLTVRSGEYVTIYKGKDAIVVHNKGATSADLAFDAARSWSIIRSDAKHVKEDRNDDQSPAVR